MNKAGYKIMHVGGGTESAHGEIVIVKANPIKNNGFGLYHSMIIGNDTEKFFFPNNEVLINQILNIARGEGIWHPNEDDFSAEYLFDEDRRCRVLIYRHKSFFTGDYYGELNSGYSVCLIPNMSHKIYILSQQYYTRNWFESYCSFRSYVESLAEDDDVNNFFGWLFDRPELNNVKPWELPSNFEDEYERFLDACSNASSSDQL